MSSLILGLGRRGSLHLRCLLASHPDMHPVYGIDPHVLDGTEQSESLVPVTDIRDIPAPEDLRVVIIASPASMHLRHLQLALAETSCPVLVEKPSVVSRAELAGLAELPSSMRDRVFVGYAERDNPVLTEVHRRIRQELEQSDLVQVTTYRTRPQGQVGRWSEGVGLELLLHDLDFLLDGDRFDDLAVEDVQDAPDRCVVEAHAGPVALRLHAEWTQRTSTSIVQTTSATRGTSIFDVSSGGDAGRLAALHTQLERVLRTRSSPDLLREARILPVVLGEGGGD